MQTDAAWYKYGANNGCSEVITGVEFNCAGAMQGAHHVLEDISNKRRLLANRTYS